MNIRTLKLKDIKPADYNPRVELKTGDDEYEALKGSLNRFGLVEPLVVNERTGNLVSGHQRLNVLIAEGEKEAEVVVIDVSEDDEKLANVAVNKIEGDWDYERLKELFSEMEDDDIKFTGFSADEIGSMFDEDEPAFEDETDYEEENDGSDKEKTEEHSEVKEFSIFLSFPSKEAAEEWLKDRDVEAEYEGMSRNITIRMEGLDYDKRD